MTQNILICPKCACRLTPINGSLVCDNRHTYDIASSGYVNLNTKPTPAGDSPEMVQARSRFLDAGYYKPFADVLIGILNKLGHRIIVDAGCGEGYYSTMISKELADTHIYGFDLSKSAINKAAKRAGKNNPNAHFFVCGIFELPLANQSTDAVINLFAPCADREFARILKPGGHLIMGVAGEDHLLGLKRALYDEIYLNQPEKVTAPDGFCELMREKVKYSVKIARNELIGDLFSMTPYYWKTSEQDALKLKDLTELETILDFDIIVFERYKN